MGLTKAMGESVGYWSDRQYKIFKLICAGIGTLFLLVNICFYMTSEKICSDEKNRIVFILDLSAFF